MGASSTPQPDATRRTRVHIRWMIRRDMPEVLEIERKSFEFPWFEEDFIRCLAAAQLYRHGRRTR